MVIFELEDNIFKRRCLIEFKANNASKLDHKKDFVKLENSVERKKTVKEEEDVKLCYFIEILGSYNKGTISSLQGKTENKEKTEFICYSLNKGERVKI